MQPRQTDRQAPEKKKKKEGKKKKKKKKKKSLFTSKVFCPPSLSFNFNFIIGAVGFPKYMPLTWPCLLATFNIFLAFRLLFCCSSFLSLFNSNSSSLRRRASCAWPPPPKKKKKMKKKVFEPTILYYNLE